MRGGRSLSLASAPASATFSAALSLSKGSGLQTPARNAWLGASSEARMIFVCVARKNDYPNVYREKIDGLFPY